MPRAAARVNAAHAAEFNLLTTKAGTYIVIFTSSDKRYGGHFVRGRPCQIPHEGIE